VNENLDVVNIFVAIAQFVALAIVGPVDAPTRSVWSLAAIMNSIIATITQRAKQSNLLLLIIVVVFVFVSSFVRIQLTPRFVVRARHLAHQRARSSAERWCEHASALCGRVCPDHRAGCCRQHAVGPRACDRRCAERVHVGCDQVWERERVRRALCDILSLDQRLERCRLHVASPRERSRVSAARPHVVCHRCLENMDAIWNVSSADWGGHQRSGHVRERECAAHLHAGLECDAWINRNSHVVRPLRVCRDKCLRVCLGRIDPHVLVRDAPYEVHQCVNNRSRNARGGDGALSSATSHWCQKAEQQRQRSGQWSFTHSLVSVSAVFPRSIIDEQAAPRWEGYQYYEHVPRRRQCRSDLLRRDDLEPPVQVPSAYTQQPRTSSSTSGTSCARPSTNPLQHLRDSPRECHPHVFHPHVCREPMASMLSVFLDVGFFGLLRPGELQPLCRMLISLPGDVAGWDQEFAVVAICESENYRPLGRFQFATIRNARASRWSAWLCRDPPEHIRLWPASPALLREMLEQLCQALEIDIWEIMWVSLRAGVATYWFTQGAEVARLGFWGRWASPRSLSHYIQ
jgi:hypothetical protein